MNGGRARGARSLHPRPVRSSLGRHSAGHARRRMRLASYDVDLLLQDDSIYICLFKICIFRSTSSSICLLPKQLF